VLGAHVIVSVCSIVGACLWCLPRYTPPCADASGPRVWNALLTPSVVSLSVALGILSWLQGFFPPWVYKFQNASIHVLCDRLLALLLPHLASTSRCKPRGGHASVQRSSGPKGQPGAHTQHPWSWVLQGRRQQQPHQLADLALQPLSWASCDASSAASRPPSRSPLLQGGARSSGRGRARLANLSRTASTTGARRTLLFKTAFRRKSPDDQQQWFREQKRARTAEGMRHTSCNFDSLEIAEVQQQSTGEEMRERIHWKPYAVWAEEKACLTMWLHAWL
jgi:hypothetical protein